MVRRFRSGALILGCCLAIPGLTALNAARAATTGTRVLIMPFEAAVDGDAASRAGDALWLGQGVAVLLADDLAGRGISVIPRESLVRAFDRLQLPLSPVLTRATMMRVAELLGASDVVFGEVRLGQRLSVRARIIRLEAGALAADAAGNGTFDQIFDIAHRVGGDVAARFGRAAAAAAAAPHLPLDAFQNYMKGLVSGTPAAQQRFFESALKQAPRDPAVLLGLWGVYTQQGAHEKALNAASAVPKDSSSAREARFCGALSLIDLGRLPGAFQELTALHAQQAAGALSNAIGVVQLRRGANGGAGSGTPVSYFTRATKEDPGNPDYVFNLGYASALAHDTAAALLWLREAVRYDAPDGDAHLVMSAVLAGEGRSAEAQRELDLARLLGAHGGGASSVPSDRIPAALERLLPELEPVRSAPLSGMSGPAQRDHQEEAAFQLTQGRKWIEAKNDRAAIDPLRRAIYLAPYEDVPHLLLGQIYARGGRLQDAIDEFKVALWCRDTAAAHVALGEALLVTGDRDGARREAGRALALDPASADAQAFARKANGGAVLPSDSPVSDHD